MKMDWKETHVGPVLPEQRRGLEPLMIFCARQRAASDGCAGAGRPFFLLAEPPR